MPPSRQTRRTKNLRRTSRALDDLLAPNTATTTTGLELEPTSSIGIAPLSEPKNVDTHPTSNLKRKHSERSPRPTEEISHGQGIDCSTASTSGHGDTALDGANVKRNCTSNVTLNTPHPQINPPDHVQAPFRDPNLPYRSSGYKSELWLPRNPVLTPMQADECCAQYTSPENLLVYLNSITGYTLDLEEPNLEAGLELLISRGHDVGTAYAWFRTSFIFVSDDPNSALWGRDPQWFALYSGLPDLSHCDSTLITAERPEASSVDKRMTTIRQAENGELRIAQPRESHPRRLWDLVSNRVVPYDWHARTPRVYKRMLKYMPPLGQEKWVPFVALSHSWAKDLSFHLLPVNRRQWPIPLPHGVALEAIRDELLTPLEAGTCELVRREDELDLVEVLTPQPHDIEYCWLDILCLRQAWKDMKGNLLTNEPDVLKRHAPPTDILHLEQKRLREWEIDVPTIGGIYRRANGIFIYMNGIGRPISDKSSDWKNPHHWINRTWTLQEYCKNDVAVVMGCPPRSEYMSEFNTRSPCMVFHLMQDPESKSEPHEDLEFPCTLSNGRILNHCLRLVARRHCSNNVDKVAGLFFLLGADALPELPVYMPNEHIEDAWKRFINALTNRWKWEITLHVSQPFDQLYPIWNGLISAVSEDRTDLPSPLLFAEPLVGSLGLRCRSTQCTSRNTPLPEPEEWMTRWWGIDHSRLDRFRSCKWTISAPGPQSDVALTFIVGSIDMDVRAAGSNTSREYYIVPQLHSPAERKGRATGASSFLSPYGPHYFLVCTPQNRWDGISLKKVGVAVLNNHIFEDQGVEEKFRELFDRFYEGPDLQILVDIQKLSPQAMKEKYGSRKVYSLIS